MRVHILTTSFPLYDGIAVGIHVIEQARHLVELGLEVEVLAPHHQGAERNEVIDGIRVRRFRYMLPARWQMLCYGAGIPTNLRTSLIARLQLPLFLLAFLVSGLKHTRDCDLIHAHWSLAGFAALILGRLRRKPVVLMMHGAEIFVLKGNRLMRLLLKHVDAVVCNSRFTQSKIEQIAQPKSVRVIAPGVNVSRFSPDHSVDIFRQREPRVPSDMPLLFALGKFIERKGFRHLINALALLNGSHRPFLMIGGRGPLKGELQAQVAQMELEDRVHFLDYIPDRVLPAYYTAADVFVLPSVVDDRSDTEGLGVVLLEALACQTPCVATSVGGIPDVIKDGYNGFLVEPANPAILAEKVSCLLEDDELRIRFGISGRAFVTDHFSWKAKAEEWLTLYTQVKESHAA